MSDMRPILVAAAGRAMAAAGEEFSPALWRTLEDAGLPQASVAEGADWGDALAILNEAGRRALPAPLAETMIAARLLRQHGLVIPPGPLTLAAVEPGALSLARAGTGWRSEGRARFVPWARDSNAILIVASDHVAVLPRAAATLVPGWNLAGEPRDDLTFAADLPADSVAAAPQAAETLMRCGALGRAAMLAGALDTVLEITVRYAGERTQFGRPIARFQAIQQQLSTLAEETAAAKVAYETAADRDEPFLVAVAKARTGAAAGPAAAIAHQVLGAMGFAREHRLNLFTRRLWAWREEFGDEAYWWRILGRAAAEAGGAGLWRLIADRA